MPDNELEHDTECQIQSIFHIFLNNAIADESTKLIFKGDFNGKIGEPNQEKLQNLLEIYKYSHGKVGHYLDNKPNLDPESEEGIAAEEEGQMNYDILCQTTYALAEHFTLCALQAHNDDKDFVSKWLPEKATKQDMIKAINTKGSEYLSDLCQYKRHLG